MHMWLQIQSTMGTVKLADVARAAEGAPLMMFQLYVIKDRDFCRKLILGEPLPKSLLPRVPCPAGAVHSGQDVWLHIAGMITCQGQWQLAAVRCE